MEITWNGGSLEAAADQIVNHAVEQFQAQLDEFAQANAGRPLDEIEKGLREGLLSGQSEEAVTAYAHVIHEGKQRIVLDPEIVDHGEVD